MRRSCSDGVAVVAASGLGALCGALYLASRRTVLGLGRLIPIAVIALGIIPEIAEGLQSASQLTRPPEA